MILIKFDCSSQYSMGLFVVLLLDTLFYSIIRKVGARLSNRASAGNYTAWTSYLINYIMKPLSPCIQLFEKNLH